MRPEKASIVSDLSEKLKRSPFVLVTDYQRMKVGDFGELRNRLSPAGAEVHVVKNNFLKRAMTDSGFPDVGEKLVGQTAVVTGEKDVAPIAKIFKTFASEFKIAALRIGFVNRAVLSTAELETLAELPPREVLQAQLLGLLLSPATRLVRLLNQKRRARRHRRRHKDFSPALAGGEVKQNCPGWWLSALILRRLSEAAIRGNKNGRYKQISGTTQRAVRA